MRPTPDQTLRLLALDLGIRRRLWELGKDYGSWIDPYGDPVALWTGDAAPSYLAAGYAFAPADPTVWMEVGKPRDGRCEWVEEHGHHYWEIRGATSREIWRDESPISCALAALEARRAT